jgi:hypothetical protein
MTKGSKGRSQKSASLILLCVLCASGNSHAQAAAVTPTANEAAVTTGRIEWEYGAFVDGAYLEDFNDPDNHLFRSRGTTYKVDEPILNIGGAYIRKRTTEQSRWGMEATFQAGQDTRVFGFSATASNMPGYRGLRHLGPTNFTYLAPVGKGLTIQGGIFSSLIGYDSLYPKDNLTYTRPWGADFTPYLMLGVNASYPFTDKLNATFFVVNGYWHLANANAVPSTGGQVAYKASEHFTLKQTLLYGPHQVDTSLEFWRFLSDSLAEWKGEKTTVALEYFVGTERVAGPGGTRTIWTSSQLPIHYVFGKGWSGTLRPEWYWDPDGRTTAFRQSVKALTTSIEYRVPYKQNAAVFRLEHRFDDSRGPDGGFFRGRGNVLTPRQNLLVFAVILTFDSKFKTGGQH